MRRIEQICLVGVFAVWVFVTVGLLQLDTGIFAAGGLVVTDLVT